VTDGMLGLTHVSPLLTRYWNEHRTYCADGVQNANPIVALSPETRRARRNDERLEGHSFANAIPMRHS
jgi:hypothetical protein